MRGRRESPKRDQSGARTDDLFAGASDNDAPETPAHVDAGDDPIHGAGDVRIEQQPEEKIDSSIAWYAKEQRRLYEAGLMSASAWWAARGRKWP